jgi:6-phosphogluconolactonase (cycloisomerase 2 family)
MQLRRHIALTGFLLAVLVGTASENAEAAATYSPAGPVSPTVDMPRSVSFNSSGSFLAVAGSGPLSRYAIPEGGALEKLAPSIQCAGSNVAFKPNSNVLASVNTLASTVSLCTVSSSNGNIAPLGSPTLAGTAPTSVDFSPDGQFLATTNRDGISMFSVGSNTPTPVNSQPFFVGLEGTITSATFSPDSRFLLVTSDCPTGPTLKVFEVFSNGVLNQVDAVDLPGSQCAMDTSFIGTSPRFIAVAADSLGSSQTNLVTYYLGLHGEIEERFGTIPSGPGAVDLAVSPNGNLIAYTNFQEDTLTLLRHAQDGALSPVMSVSPGDGPSSVAFSADGNLLGVTTESDDSVELYHLAPGPTLLPAGAPTRLEGSASFLAASSTGRVAVTTEQQNGIELFTLSPAGGLTRTVKVGPEGVTNPHGAAFSADGNLLAVAGDDGLSTYTVSAAGVPIHTGYGDVPGVPYRVAFSPDGTLLASASYGDNLVSLFSVAPDGALTYQDSWPTTAGPRSLSFSPDGSLLVTANDLGGDIKVFGVSGTTLTFNPPFPTGGSPAGVAFRPTGGQLAVVDYTREEISTHAINANGQMAFLDSRHVDRPAWVAWSPSGDVLAAVSEPDSLGRPSALWTFSVSEEGVLKRFGDPTYTDLEPSGLAFDASGRFILIPQGRAVWVYPLAAPALDTVIAVAPAAYDNQASPRFDFDASYPSRYECQLDSGSFAPCEWSSAIQVEADGPHTLAVRARDPVGNVDPTPATHSWIRDTTPPSTAAPATPLNGTANLPPTTSFSWEPSADELSGVDRYELLVDGGARGAVGYPSTCGATCTVVMSGLVNGTHTWTVRARDVAGNTSESAARTFSVDAEPPGLSSLLLPSGEAVVGSAHPTLSWLPAIDAGSGVDHYEISVDDKALPSTTATSIQVPTALADGAHSWSLLAVDRIGNRSSPVSATFETDTTAPFARLAAGPRQTLPGITVVLDAHESMDTLGAIVDFSWDTNGDGVLDRSTGTNPLTTTTFTIVGTYHLSVHVTDEAGLTSTASVDVTITPANAGALGQGAGVRFIPPKATGSRFVTLVLTPPAGARAARISNDDDPNQPGIKRVVFDGHAAATTDWLLDPQTSPGKEAKQVFVWFERGAELIHTSPTIILDEEAPEISAATFTVSRTRTGRRRAKVRVKANDHRGTGITRMRIGSRCSGSFEHLEAKPRNGTYAVSIRPPKSRLRVTVRDAVGNASRCVTARKLG